MSASHPPVPARKKKLALAFFAFLTALPAVYCAFVIGLGAVSPWSLLIGVMMTVSTQISWRTLLSIAEDR